MLPDHPGRPHADDRRRPDRGPALPEHRRVRLRRRGARGLVERRLSRGRRALPLLRPAAAGRLPRLRRGGVGRRLSRAEDRPADDDRRQRPRLRRGLPGRSGADVEDGLLDAVSFENMGLGSRVGALVRLLRGTHLRHPKVSAARARRLVYRFAEPPAYETDGEWNQAKSNEIVIEAVPKALRVLAPAP
ncbi:MAG: hypothetical protein U0599_18970 [Vicinamibacteria bacterium]